MKTTQTTIEALKIDPVVMFKGTEAEQHAAAIKEAAAIMQLQTIIENPDFLAMRIQPRKPGDVERILHHSTRPGIDYQLSILYKGDALSHHNYNINEAGHQNIKNLYKEIISLIYTDTSINIEILTA